MLIVSLLRSQKFLAVYLQQAVQCHAHSQLTLQGRGRYVTSPA